MKKLAIILLGLLMIPATISKAQTFTQTVFVDGLVAPVTTTFSPDGRLFITEKDGKIRVVKNGVLQSNPFLTLPVTANSERGLLGITFDPNFSSNRYIYVYYTRANTPVKNRLSRFTASATNPDIAEIGSEKILLDDIPSDAGNHNGGTIAFGKDGKLYIAIGDGGQTRTNAQLLSSLSGKILRINSDGTIPSDNPFFNTVGARKEIWAYGFRNPFTFAVDQLSGKIHVNDVGEASWEEINLLTKGANYGWPKCEGPKNTGVGECSDNSITYPIHSYGRDVGKSITGAVFNNGDYYFGDFVSGFIKKLSSTGVLTQIADVSNPTDIDIGRDNNIYYTSYVTGKVIKLIPTATPINGQCSQIINMCVAGNVNDTPDTETHNNWSCVGISSGTTANCTTAKSITTNRPPVATITSPIIDSRYNAGQILNLSGTGIDPEEGSLPPSAFSWTVAFHHDTHSHPFIGPITGKTTESVTIPTTGELSDNVWYRITLKVTDSKGMSSEVYHNIYPNKVDLIFNTNPTGQSIILDGQPKITPYKIKSVVGMDRVVSADTTKTIDGKIFKFLQWSNNGTQSQVLRTPSTDSTFRADYSIPRPTNTIFEPEYGSGDLAKHLQEEIDNRISNQLAGLTSKLLWLTRGNDTKNWESNPSKWTNQIKSLNWTGVSPWNSQSEYLRGGVLISPRHVLHAKHFKFSVNTKIAFIDLSGSIVIRNIIDVKELADFDVAIALLDKDVPEYITFYPVVERSIWQKYLEHADPTTEIPIVVFDQEDKIGVRALKINRLYNNTANIIHDRPTKGKRVEFNEDIVGGDSGNPAFTIIGGQPVLLFTNYDINFGPNLSNLTSQVNTLMSSMGGGYQLSTVNLNRFTIPTQVVNTAPSAQNVTFNISSPGTIANIILNATDSQNDTITYSPSTLSTPKGNLVKTSEGKYTYTLKTPLPLSSFTETLTYTASDGKLISSPANITINYTAPVPKPNTAPVAMSSIYSASTDAIEIIFVATDAQNDILTINTSGTLKYGTLTKTPANKYIYNVTNRQTVDVSDIISFTASDGKLSSNQAIITINISKKTVVVNNDSDGDGILLPVDKCPNTPLSLKNQVNKTGCIRPKLTKFNTKPLIEDDITNVSNVKLGINNIGEIKFTSPIRLTRDNTVIDLDTNVIIEKEKVEIKSSVIPELNKPAIITLYNIDKNNPRILKDGVLCPISQCTINSFSNKTLVFTVNGFSVYTIDETPVVIVPPAEPNPEPVVETPRKKSGGRGGGGGNSVQNISTEQLIAQLTAQLNALIAQLNELLGNAGIITKNLSIGSQDPEVKILQEKLIRKGYTLVNTGYFGTQTRDAIIKFQKENGITPTGTVGPITRGKLN